MIQTEISSLNYISKSVKAFQGRGEPVISVDTKKKELIGQYANKGREWQPKGNPAGKGRGHSMIPAISYCCLHE